jgi:hypothetical protein
LDEAKTFCFAGTSSVENGALAQTLMAPLTKRAITAAGIGGRA